MFGALLRRYRAAAGLTQEELAARTGLTSQAISLLERGQRRHPQAYTVGQLAEALALTVPEQQALATAARHLSPPRLAASLGPRVLSVPGRAVHNLPMALTRLIGREQETAEVARLLGATRLLTLFGTGGVGKTRLALEVAATIQAGYPQGVWFVELAALADPASVPLAITTTLGLHEEAGQPHLATLVAALRSRRLLLVLDHCEHLTEACAALADALIHACPAVRIMATSREALRIAGEIAWRVPSLALPPPQRLPPHEELGQVAAVRLFVERAQAVQPQFALAAHNASAVAQICRQLDGIPLALELAAARVRGLSVAHLAARLDQRFRLLREGNRAAPLRQQTIRAVFDWSYELLGAPEQIFFNRLSVFAGSFTLEAMEAVCVGTEVPADTVLDVFLRLVDTSLVVAEDGGGYGRRYRLLETGRQYGHERLIATEEADDLAARHAGYYRALAEDVWADTSPAACRRR